MNKCWMSAFFKYFWNFGKILDFYCLITHVGREAGVILVMRIPVRLSRPNSSCNQPAIENFMILCVILDHLTCKQLLNCYARCHFKSNVLLLTYHLSSNSWKSSTSMKATPETWQGIEFDHVLKLSTNYSAKLQRNKYGIRTWNYDARAAWY